MTTPANSYAIPQKKFVGSQSQAMLTSYKYPPGEQRNNEKSQLASYILSIYNSFSRITLIDDSGKTISARRLPEKSLPQYDALWCAVPNEKKRKRRRDHCINGIAISANIDNK